MKVLYKPTLSYLVVDISVMVLWGIVIFNWLPFTLRATFDKLSLPALYYIFTWGAWSLTTINNQPAHNVKHIQKSSKLFYTLFVILILFHVIILNYFAQQYSENVLYVITISEYVLNFLLLTIYFSSYYEVNFNELSIVHFVQKQTKDENIICQIDKTKTEETIQKIKKHVGESGFHYINSNTKLNEGSTLIISAIDPNELMYMPYNLYSTIIQLKKLNNLRGINKMLSFTNKILPENGLLICCYESKSTYKKFKLGKTNKKITYILYCFDYIFKRVLPKLRITKWFYYIFSGCKSRVISKAEVLGRLYYCGFKVEQEKKIGQLNFVIARRTKNPETFAKRNYGPFIRLKRFGKDGKPFNVYKMRTMHPYSEFLQSYIYERNNLKDGGKFNKDIRITTLGRYLRKYWLDELPMFLNLIRGEMKLVGVRPLSQQYFSLYDKELQEKRIKFKPGLLPPFYADMPKTLEEIQASEMKYLTLCEKSEFNTDVHYFILILRNIVIKKARSA